MKSEEILIGFKLEEINKKLYSLCSTGIEVQENGDYLELFLRGGEYNSLYEEIEIIDSFTSEKSLLDFLSSRDGYIKILKQIKSYIYETNKRALN